MPTRATLLLSAACAAACAVVAALLLLPVTGAPARPVTPPPPDPSASSASVPSEPTADDDRTDEAAARLDGLAQASGRARFGLHPDWAVDTPAAYTRRTGICPVVYGEFVELPLPQAPDAVLEAKVGQVAAADAVLLLTLEPTGGLATVTDDGLADLTTTLTRWNAAGTPVLVRFGHEMNGSWYPWGQQPTDFIDAFRRVSAAVRAAPAAQVMWSPNEGGGYPFTGGAHGAAPGSPDTMVLDTDSDGTLTRADDPYAPYFPGAQHVDWVGLTVYHFGSVYPWGENEVPEDAKLLAKLRGTYDGLAGDETATPDFAQVYGEALGLPLAVAETSALFSTGQDGLGATDPEIKTAWVEQVLDPTLATTLPALRLVVWFDQDKLEAETGVTTLWSHSYDETLSGLVRDRLG